MPSDYFSVLNKMGNKVPHWEQLYLYLKSTNGRSARGLKIEKKIRNGYKGELGVKKCENIVSLIDYIIN